MEMYIELIMTNVLTKNNFTIKLLVGRMHDDRFKVVGDLIVHKNMIYLILESNMKEKILRSMYDTPLVGNPRYFNTYK